MVAQAGEEDDVADADDRGGEGGHLGSGFGGVGEGGADQVGDAGAGGDGEGEGDLEGEGGQGGEHGLGGERGPAKVGGGEGEELKGEHLGLDHQEARERELDHGTPVLQRFPREAVPAGHSAFAEEADVDDEAEGEEVVGDGDGDGGADEAPLEFPDEEPVHQGVEGGADDEDVEGGGEEALGLEEAFSGFEGGVAGRAEEDDFEVEAGEGGDFGLGDDEPQDVVGEEPDYGDRDGDGPEEVGHALHLEADEFAVAGAVGLGAEGVEAGGETLVDGVAGDVGGHGGEAHST